jgi:curved DNA-binding protein CbpA
MSGQREWYEKDYYAVLGVSKDATVKDITKAYRRLARQYHPDANPDNAVAEEKFKDISAAYDVVGDEKKRAEYDEVRRVGPMGGFGGGPGGQNIRFDMGGDGFGDILGQMFGRGGGRRGGGSTGPQRGQDIETTLTLDFVARHVLVQVLAPVQHRKHALPVVVAVLLQTTKECFRSRNHVVHAAAMASLSKIRVLHVKERELNVVHVK